MILIVVLNFDTNPIKNEQRTTDKQSKNTLSYIFRRTNKKKTQISNERHKFPRIFFAYLSHYVDSVFNYTYSYIPCEKMPMAHWHIQHE